MCNICNNSILDIKNAVDVTSKEFIDKLWEIFALDANKISVFNPEIVKYIEELLLEEAIPNSIKGNANNKNFNNNLYNFSLYKTANFMETAKNIKNNFPKSQQVQLFQSKMNTVMGSELVVEKYQVEKVTTLSKTFKDSAKSDLLTYVSYVDKRTRPVHLSLNKTTLPKNDSRWARLLKELSEYNCRCFVTESEDKKFLEPPKLEDYVEANEISKIDIVSGRVITFSENHPVYSGLDNQVIIRKQRKNEFLKD